MAVGPAPADHLSAARESRPSCRTPPNRKNHNNNQSPDDDWVGELIWALAKAAGYLLWWAILFPALSVPAAAAIWMAIAHGVNAGLLTAAVEVAAYIGWSVWEPSSFDRWVSAPLRQRFPGVVALRASLGIGVYPARFDHPTR